MSAVLSSHCYLESSQLNRLHDGLGKRLCVLLLYERLDALSVDLHGRRVVLLVLVQDDLVRRYGRGLLVVFILNERVMSAG